MCTRIRNRPSRTIRCSRRCSRRARRGFTLIEVVVAVVLIDVGLMSLVAGSAVLLRRIAQTRAESAARQTAGNRLETLASQRCVASVGTSVGPNGLREEWSSELSGAGTRELRDSVTYTALGQIRSIVVRTRGPC
jgi:prepilin-type N-terminal cleavage/methylation domain-containing protein